MFSGHFSSAKIEKPQAVETFEDAIPEENDLEESKKNELEFDDAEVESDEEGPNESDVVETDAAKEKQGEYLFEIY